jgi:hypothetical protein
LIQSILGELRGLGSERHEWTVDCAASSLSRPVGVALPVCIRHIREVAAKDGSAKGPHPPVHGIGVFLVDLGNQRGMAGRERVRDLPDEMAAQPSPRDICRCTKDKVGRRTHGETYRPPPSKPIRLPTAVPPIVP